MNCSDFYEIWCTESKDATPTSLNLKDLVDWKDLDLE